MQGANQNFRKLTRAAGRLNTIHKHLATWSDSRPAAAAAPAELPQALVMAIGAEIGRVAAQARSEVEERLVHGKHAAIAY